MKLNYPQIIGAISALLILLPAAFIALMLLAWLILLPAYQAYFEPQHDFCRYAAGEYAGAFAYLNANTSQDDKVLAWWDYGRCIKTSANRAPVLLGPSSDAKVQSTVASSTRPWWDDPLSMRGFFLGETTEPAEKVLDVAAILTDTNESESASLMRKYNATYILLMKDDMSKFGAIAYISGRNMTPATFYCQGSSPVLCSSYLGNETLMLRTWSSDYDFIEGNGSDAAFFPRENCDGYGSRCVYVLRGSDISKRPLRIPLAFKMLAKDILLNFDLVYWDDKAVIYRLKNG